MTLFYIVVISLLLIFGLVVLLLYIDKSRSSHKRDNFFYHAIHEMKNPLSTITLTSEMLYEMGSLDDYAHKLVKMIITENKRVSHSVDLFLHYAKIQRDELTIQKKPVDIHALLSDSLLIHEFFLEKEKGILKTNLEASKAIVKGDKMHLTNVFDNLLENARKYSKSSAEISVTTRNESDYLIVSVTDNGIGIDPSFQKDIFKQFYRVKNKGNVHASGFGMGLFYVKYIIKRHKGKITLRSQPCEGSTFNVYLPVIDKPDDA